MKITIITVCHNSEKYLQETIDSVAAQHYKNIEYIIVDGASTDSTVSILQQNEHKLACWITEPDKGMYDAINKGLQKTTGDYILVLNSDDVLVNENVIEKMVASILKDRLDYYYGNIVKVKDGKCKKVKLFNVSYSRLLLSTHGTFAPHPCFFISAGLNKQLGGYTLAYKYASDYDYILRALAQPGSKGRHVDLYITCFRIHENSITASGKIENDRQEILNKHGYYSNHSVITRNLFYYTQWIYYKLINTGHRFRVGCI